MTGDDIAVLVDQDWDDKSECGNAIGNLANLFLRVCPRVTRIGLERVDGEIGHETLL